MICERTMNSYKTTKMETYQRLMKLSGATFLTPLDSFTISHGTKWLLKTWHRMFFINFIDILKSLDLNLRLQPICTEPISTQLTRGSLGINGKIFYIWKMHRITENLIHPWKMNGHERNYGMLLQNSLRNSGQWS